MATWLLAVSCVALAAQAAPPRDTPSRVEAGAAVVRGRITSAATGEPLHRVRVTLNGSNPNPPIAVTDTRGAFEITDVPVGSYSITAARAGYLSVQYGQRRSHEAGRTVEVGAGQILEQINMALPRGGVLAGGITDDTGEEYPGVRVEAIELRYVRGRRMPVQAASATTNDLGQFRLSGLPPGTYLLRASSADTWEGDEDKSTYAYVPTYFPGVTSTDLAESISVAVGQEISQLDFGLRPGRTARITGTMQNANGEPLSMQAINLDHTLRGVGGAPFSMQFGGSARTNREGAFELRNLAPGEYLVYSGSSADRVAVSVVLAEGDVRHVELMPRKPVAVDGSIVTDEGTPAPFQSGRVSVMPMATGSDNLLPSFTGPGRVTVNRDWTFRIANMDGQYLFRVAGLPDEWMLGAVLADGRTITDAPVTVRPGAVGPGRLQLVLTRKGVRIDGRVTTPDGTPSADNTVMIFAADSRRWTPASRFVKAVRPDSAGRFSVGGLPAGVYAAIARDFVADGQWEDPEFLQSLMPDAARVEVVEGGSETVMLILEPSR